MGYDERGFLVHNSWGEGWGDGGYATLTYADWVDNAMDCWVAQLGVVTEEHRRVASSPIGLKKGAALSSDRILVRHQIAPYVINMENNGRLSSSGAFRTGEDDVRSLVTDYLDAARRDWGLKRSEPIDICLYAHGGLVGEDDAARTFAKWWPALYKAKRFPVFVMWESDLWSTIKARLEDVVKKAPRPTAGPLEALGKWWNERLESMLAPAGGALWGEMKQNAQALSGEPESGLRLLFKHLNESALAQRGRVPAAPGRAFGGLHRARLPHRPAGGAGMGVRERELHGAGPARGHLRRARAALDRKPAREAPARVPPHRFRGEAGPDLPARSWATAARSCTSCRIPSRAGARCPSSAWRSTSPRTSRAFAA